MEYKFNKELFNRAMKEKKISRDELAVLLTEKGHTISLNGINHWFRAEQNRPEIEKAYEISKILDVPFDELAIVKNTNIVNGLSPVKLVPIVASVSCGLPAHSVFDDERSTYYHGDFWHKDLYAVVACGDSMAPDIEDGDEIVCDPTAKIYDGDIVHYTIYGDHAIKIYHDNADLDAIELIPYNQSPEFKTRCIRKDDEAMNDLKMSKVVSINKLRLNNRKARLRLVGRA